MRLWCERHGANHDFSDNEVERIVYAFQFALADEEMNQPITDYDNEVRCLNEVLLWSIATDVYEEKVTAFVLKRMEVEGR